MKISDEKKRRFMRGIFFFLMMIFIPLVRFRGSFFISPAGMESKKKSLEFEALFCLFPQRIIPLRSFVPRFRDSLVQVPRRLPSNRHNVAG